MNTNKFINKFLLIGFAVAVVATGAQAFAQDNKTVQRFCSLGKINGRPTFTLDGSPVDAYSQLDGAVEAFIDAKDAGLCSSQRSYCSVGRRDGLPTLTINGSVVRTYANLDRLVVGFTLVKRAGVCTEAKSRCAPGKSVNGTPAALVNDQAVLLYADEEGTKNALEALKQAEVCY